MKDIDKMTGSEWIAYRADKLDAFHAKGLELIPNPKCTTCDVDNDYVCLACEITQVDGETK